MPTTVPLKTKDLSGQALDWAVMKTQGWTVSVDEFLKSQLSSSKFSYSTVYAKGGSVMDEAEIDTYMMERGSPLGWLAEITGTSFKAWGRTRLIAAMRCLVMSKLGDVVDVPVELVEVATHG